MRTQMRCQAGIVIELARLQNNESVKATPVMKTIKMLALPMALAVLGMIMIGCGGTSKKRVFVEGFIDSSTSNSIQHAKVIVTAWSGGLWGLGNAKHEHFFTLTDNTGAFSVDADVDFNVHKIVVEASSPSNEYALLNVSGKQIRIKLAPLSEWHKNAGRFAHEAFSGMFRATHATNVFQTPAIPNEKYNSE